jgi:L-ascorbate metabolism protein UlaG (beta-lactamase superfamily)
MQLTWLGRSCFEIVTRDDTRVLFDPFLEWCPQPPVTPELCCEITVLQL